MSSQILVITGMHRSGTSLAANLLQKSGLHIGSRLIPPGPANPHGFFEDADFVEFQSNALEMRGQSHIPSEGFMFQPTPSELAKAQSLIRGRAHMAIWGWKDPRTTLFLDFWYQLLPQATFLFLYRHPIEVLLSLLRSGEYRVAGVTEGIQSWMIYDALIVDFFKLHPQQCILCHTYSLLDQTEQFNQIAIRKLGCNLNISGQTLQRVYIPGDLRRLTPDAEINSVLDKIFPRAIQIYQQLEELADLPRLQNESRTNSQLDLSLLKSIVDTLPQADPFNRVALLLFLATLDPEAVRGFYSQYRARIAGMDSARRWTEEQRASWQSEAQHQAVIVSQLRSWISELENGKAWLEEQRARWQAEAERLNQIIAEQETLIAALEKDK